MFLRPNKSIEMNALLMPYLYLDESLIKDGDDGKACFKKYSNEGQGMPRAVWIKLNNLATAILNDTVDVAPEERLTYIDVFTLYSNHLDQQRINDRPDLKEKEALVLNFLKAAYKLSPIYDYNHLNQYTTRELSSHEQMLHYLGKAERYDDVAVELRLVKLEQSLVISTYLSALGCDKENDPGAYKNRVATRELAVNYCYQDLHRYDDAAALILPQLKGDSAFHRTQAHIQLSQIYSKKYQHQGGDLNQVLEHAVLSVEDSHLADSSLLQYNARVCLMNAYQLADHQDEANAMAQAIMNEMDANADCGAKPLHREAAEKIIAANRSVLSSGI